MIDKFSAKRDFPLIVTAYTITSHLGDYYKRCVTRLIRSCIKFDLSHLVLPLEKQDGWDAGCATKIVVIQQLLKQLNRPLLWLDADAEIFAYPSLFEKINCEMALASVCGHWLSGTLYFTPHALPFIETWKQRTGPDVDEVALKKLYTNLPERNRPRMIMLPDTYNTAIYAGYDTSKIVVGHHMRPDVAPSRGVIANPVPEL